MFFEDLRYHGAAGRTQTLLPVGPVFCLLFSNHRREHLLTVGHLVHVARFTVVCLEASGGKSQEK